LEGEVTNHPHEGGEILRVLLGVNLFLADPLGLEMNVLGEVDDKGKVREGVFVDGANRVVYEET
jgi:hypothetical protein